MDTPPQQPSNERTHHVFVTVHDYTGGIASDQTGRFPVTSNRGHAYLALFYIFDPNYIKSVPIRNRSKEELLRAYTEVYAWLTARGYRPLLHKLDNETSRDVEAFVAAEQVKIQYTPPDMHRTNPAERAVRTWKNHFTAGIAGLPPAFPIANWCRLTAQTDMTLNMLRPCRLNPLLSAHEAMDGSFSFDATPLAPLGTAVLIHLKPTRRLTWGYHAAKAWYLSHAANHYRCIRVIMHDTGAERVTDTFRFQHHAIPVPHITPTDRIIEAARRLADAIRGVQDAPSDELAAIASLRQLLLGEALPPDPHPPVPTATPTAEPTDDVQPIFMWDPLAVATPPARAASPASAPPAILPAVIPSDDEGVRRQLPVHPLLPPVAAQRGRWHQHVRPVHARPVTRGQLRERTAHMINCVIADAWSATPSLSPPSAPRKVGHAFALPHLASNVQHPAALAPHHFLGAVIDEDTGKMLEYRHLVQNESTRVVWERSFANEIGRLFQGIRHLKGTNTCFFIRKCQVPSDKRPTYGRIVCTVRPQKDEQHHTRLTVGGDRIDYPGNKSTPTADLTTVKLLLNSTISTPGAVFAGMDLANFYLNTPMPNPEYMRLRLDVIPNEIIVAYNLRDIVTPDGWVYIAIHKGMYGLPQAGILANQLLERRLSVKGYYQCQHTPGLWRHVWRSITFCLVVDDFGIKFTNKADFEHLKSALEEHYTVAIDYTGSLFCGIKLSWDYNRRTVSCTMPGYIDTALTKYQHATPVVPQHAPYQAAPIQYGAKVQRVAADTSAPLNPAEIKRVQDIVGTLLYYARAVDPTLLTALSAIAARQANGTRAVYDACHQLLDYVATHPNAGICYKACDMILAVHTDASYLSEMGGKSRAAGHFYLSNVNDEDFNNGAILTLSSIIKHVMSSASEAEMAALYYGCKVAAPLRTTLEELGHYQPKPTPVTTDNITALGLTMGTMTPKASKSMDQRFHWLKCRNAQRQFTYLWRKGILNRADYASKHHHPKHHQLVRPFYVFDSIAPLPSQ